MATSSVRISHLLQSFKLKRADVQCIIVKIMAVNINYIYQYIVVVVCCYMAEATTIYNNAIDPSPFGGNPLQSPYNTFLGLSNALGIRQPYSSAYTPFGNTFEGSSLGGSSFDGNSALKRRCPVCDSSVYGYCSEKLFHDSCCCHNPNNPYDKLPYQCQFADCSFLHANSCREHKLITACCCTNLYLYRK
ncbi:uncharacterized protein [Euwallacea similis]|uniref:uncharacterized protein isoform X2 n=1 Tax=Euwallacea similis TaxID=1736056 RepID=UPI00344B0BA3